MPPLLAPLLKLSDVGVAFDAPRGARQILSGVGFALEPGQILGVVGESGSGKSVTALAIMRLLGGQGRVTAGSIAFAGTELTTLPDAAMRKIRGAEIAMIFQEPMTSLNPLLTVGFQIAEVLREKLALSGGEARERATHLLDRVGIPNPAQRFDEYPSTLSGGMRQRVMIAIAMACAPRLLLADEPTTALDVTIQGQILALMATLSERDGAAILLITHDMGVIARMARRVVVMYAGEVVEVAPIAALLERPAHPYSGLLMAATPTVRRKARILPSIPGLMPSPDRPPPGCRFHPRCPAVIARCRVDPPAIRPLAGDRSARCHRAEDMLAGMP